MHTIYETDDVEQARLVASNNKNVSVLYHNTNLKIPPVLTLKIKGRSYMKWNPAYVEYLKDKHPGISDNEIAKCMEEAVAESLSEKAEIHQKNNKIEECDTSKNVRKR